MKRSPNLHPHGVVRWPEAPRPRHAVRGPKAYIACASIVVALACCAPSDDAGASPGVPIEVPRPQGLADFDAALADAIRARVGTVEEDRSDAQAWLELGMTYEAHLMDELAAPCYERAVALAPDPAAPWYRLAVSYGKLGRSQQALEAVDEALARAPEYGPAHNRRGDWLLQEGRFDEAAACHAAALALDAGDLAAQLGLARVALERGEPAAALELLAPFEELEEPPPAAVSLAHRLRGTALARLGRSAEAAAELADANSAGPYLPDPWTRRVGRYKRGSAALVLKANRLLGNGRVSAAIELLEGARSDDPNDVHVLRALADAYVRLERNAEAAAVLRALIDLDDDPQVALSAVRLEAVSGAHQTALELVGQLIEREPQFVAGRRTEVQLLVELGRFDAATAAARTAHEAGIEDRALDLAAGHAHLALGNAQQARAYFERGERSPAARAGLVLVALAEGDLELASSELDALRAADSTHPSLKELTGRLTNARAQSRSAPQVETEEQKPDHDEPD